ATGSFNLMLPAIIIVIFIMLLALLSIQRQNRAKARHTPSMPSPPPLPSGPVGEGIRIETKPTPKTTPALYLRTTEGHSYPLEPGPNLIGRSSTCNIQIADEQMSRQHTRITVIGTQVTVEDLSTNGTFINSHRVIIPSQLKPGDSMRCGQTIFTLQDTKSFGHTPQTPTLTIKSGTQKGAQFPLPQKPFITLGRGSENDIVIQDARASRKHAQIVKDGATYYLYDLGSAGGTLINGTPINQQYRLKNGDEIQMGHTIILFRERP
ncbi:MAG: FHA domain-containing protein, partial [Anaerolineae bacterium]|nr:FHA domain-containing protein [Anaerolineae bacterium]